MTLTLDTITIDDEAWTGVGATPSLDDWLRLLHGVRPGVSFRRCSPAPAHPMGVAHGGWLRALWGLGG